MKLTKDQIDKVRNIDGFPIAKDEDIIALSEPPYFTACPNPFIEDFINEHGKPYDEATDTYHREPFASDLSEGKADPIYSAFSYHTKVPYKAIMKHILHYTMPGDIVLDGFGGTGMTGLASHMCSTLTDIDVFEYQKDMEYVEKGARYAVISDLSPYATIISASVNLPVDTSALEEEVNSVINDLRNKCEWMYKTTSNHKESEPEFDNSATINYTIWSNVYVCPNCSNEFSLWDHSVKYILNHGTGEQDDVFKCKKCGLELNTKIIQNSRESYYDDKLNKNILRAKRTPIFINYSFGNKRYEKYVDQADLKLINKIDETSIRYWYPTDAMMFKGEQWGDMWRAGHHFGITHVHHFFTKRALMVLSYYTNIIQNRKYKNVFLTALMSALPRASIRNRYIPKHGNKHVGVLSGTLYVPEMQEEINLIEALQNRLQKIIRGLSIKENKAQTTIIGCNSCTNLNIPDKTIDYIFTDPPFGANIMYSEMNFISESWMRIVTQNFKEAIINKSQKKGILEYQDLMDASFSEYYRVLKPGRWLNVEFHNSKNSIWNCIQESILKSGFVVADVRILDKQKGTIKQLSTTSAVKQDLIISAYKPKDTFKKRFLTNAGSIEEVWNFIRQHLDQLPRTVVHEGKLEIITERQNFLLFDRMVAFHIMNGIPVPIDAPDFYKGLKERFIERDSMFFTADQVNEYDEKRIKMDVEPIQISFVVTDEKSAIAWLYSELQTPQTRQDLQPKFMQELHKVKYEAMPELDVILEDNFLQDEEGKWYIADLNKQSDLEKLRNKRLIKDFEEYLKGTGKLKVFRTEAIRAGFDNAWKKRDFATIVKVGKRLPEEVIQEDPALLMYYDNALSRLE